MNENAIIGVILIVLICVILAFIKSLIEAKQRRKQSEKIFTDVLSQFVEEKKKQENV